jgi:hypothetical protein
MVEEQDSGDDPDADTIDSTKEALFDGWEFTPNNFAWQEAITTYAPPIKTYSNTGEEGIKTRFILPADDITELQGAMADLTDCFDVLAQVAQSDAMETLQWAWKSTSSVIRVIDRINHQIQAWREITGDFCELREDRGAVNVCSKILNLPGSVDAIELGFGGHQDTLSLWLDIWEDDNIRNLTHLNEKLKSLATNTQAAQVEATQNVVPAPFILSFLTPVLYDPGIQVGMFGSIMAKVQRLRVENNALSIRLDALKADVAAQGGMVFGKHTYTSRSDAPHRLRTPFRPPIHQAMGVQTHVRHPSTCRGSLLIRCCGRKLARRTRVAVGLGLTCPHSLHPDKVS